MKIVKSGTLRFWGDWFGRPMDNVHTVTNAIYKPKEGILQLHFDQGEKCTVYHPVGIVNKKDRFLVKNASKIVFEWYAADQEHSEKNLCARIYSCSGKNEVLLEENVGARKSVKVLHSHELNAMEIC